MKLRGGNGRNFPTKERASLFKLPQLFTDSHILFHFTSSSICNVPMGCLPREVDFSDWTGVTESSTGRSSHSKPLCFQRKIWLLWHLGPDYELNLCMCVSHCVNYCVQSLKPACVYNCFIMWRISKWNRLYEREKNNAEWLMLSIWIDC